MTDTTVGSRDSGEERSSEVPDDGSAYDNRNKLGNAFSDRSSSTSSNSLEKIFAKYSLVLISKPNCPECDEAKARLKGQQFKEINTDTAGKLRDPFFSSLSEIVLYSL
jgi:hypothetical protein